MKCRHCKSELRTKFIDLGFTPPSNAYLKKNELKSSEKYYPLLVNVCHKCWLVQTEDYADKAELFDDEYSYFSSTSKSWLKHARAYSKKIIASLSLNKESFVVEVASNDGYLLKNFVKAKIPCIGVEPTKSTAQASLGIGVPVIQEFFGEKLAKQISIKYKKADLIIGNNVLAHVPDINDFAKGLKILLKKNGVITLEFPHLLNLIKFKQFDTIYHEHFSYLSLSTVNSIFAKIGLKIFNVEEIQTHGGSLRIYVSHENSTFIEKTFVKALLTKEIRFGLQNIKTYKNFQSSIYTIKNELISFLLYCKKTNKKVCAYGAAAKGNTLLNFSGIKSDLISCVYDKAKSKQGKFLPGSHLPILPWNQSYLNKYDFILILPWNLSEEIICDIARHKKIKPIFFICIPEIKFFKTKD